MKKLMIAAMAVAMFATPAMAGGRTATDPAAKEAEHAAQEELKDAVRCNKALEEYLKSGDGYASVVFWCGL